jgi:hypothetical protein
MVGVMLPCLSISPARIVSNELVDVQELITHRPLNDLMSPLSVGFQVVFSRASPQRRYSFIERLGRCGRCQLS